MLYGFRKPTARRLKDMSARPAPQVPGPDVARPYPIALFLVENADIPERTNSGSTRIPGEGQGRLLRYTAGDDVVADTDALLVPLYNMTYSVVKQDTVTHAVMVDGHWTIPETISQRKAYYRAPAAGIPPFNAVTGVLGSASCERMELDDTGTFTPSGWFTTIYNESGWIPPSSLVIAEYTSSGILVGQPPAEVLYQYQLRTKWYGGLAMAYVKSMDGYNFGQTVIINNPLGEASYQKVGDKGEMIFQPGVGKYYWIQSPCSTNTVPPEDPTGACCVTVEGEWVCFVATEADCDATSGVYHGDGTDCETVTCA